MSRTNSAAPTNRGSATSAPPVSRTPNPPAPSVTCAIGPARPSVVAVIPKSSPPSSSLLVSNQPYVSANRVAELSISESPSSSVRISVPLSSPPAPNGRRAWNSTRRSFAERNNQPTSRSPQAQPSDAVPAQPSVLAPAPRITIGVLTGLGGRSSS